MLLSPVVYASSATVAFISSSHTPFFRAKLSFSSSSISSSSSSSFFVKRPYAFPITALPSQRVRTRCKRPSFSRTLRMHGDVYGTHDCHGGCSGSFSESDAGGSSSTSNNSSTSNSSSASVILSRGIIGNLLPFSRRTSSCSSSSSSSASLSFRSLMYVLNRLRDSTTAAACGAILLACAGLFRLLQLPALISAISLYSSLTITGVPAAVNAIRQVIYSRGANVDVHVLMVVAALVCIFTGAAGEGALLTVLYALSHAAEHAVTARARRQLDLLRERAPETALIESAKSIRRVRVSELSVGDILLVRAGDVIACDAIITKGTAFISVPHLTGEAVPKTVTVGDEVSAGAQALDAELRVRVIRVGAESSLARIARMVTSARENRASVSRFFDKFGRIYARTVLSIAVVMAIAMPIVHDAFFSIALSTAPFPALSFGGHNGSLKRALAFLVATSPCALVIGAPVAYVAALSALARRGVLVKSGARAIEDAANVDTVIFDKTGTLTTGDLRLVGATRLPESEANGSERQAINENEQGDGEVDGTTLRELVSIAASLEKSAVHPLANALLTAAQELDAPLFDTSQVVTVPGAGVEGIVSYSNATNGDFTMTLTRVGSPSFVAPHTHNSERLRQLAANGETVTVLSTARGTFALRFRDELRQTAREAVCALRERGINVKILTGDGRAAAARVARDVQYSGDASGNGEKDGIAGASPKDKLEYVRNAAENAANKGSAVIMVGDGVNDAPALAAATVGVACGLSSATAVHAADVVLVRSELMDLVRFVKTCERARNVARENVVAALVLMVAATVPSVLGGIPLWMAVLMHEGGTVLVGINGLRLLR